MTTESEIALAAFDVLPSTADDLSTIGCAVIAFARVSDARYRTRHKAAIQHAGALICAPTGIHLTARSSSDGFGHPSDTGGG